MKLKNSFDYIGDKIINTATNETSEWCHEHGGYDCGAGGLSNEELEGNWVLDTNI